MSKEIIINAAMPEEVRIAILENGRLADLDIDTQSRTKHKGNIYKGIITNIEDSLEAAFLEFGEERQAFLPLAEVRPELFPEEFRDKRRVKISDVLHRGQEIVVQVTKDEIGTKGAAVSTYLSLPGRYFVLMHSDEGGGGISRKIDNESARREARELLSHMSVPEGMAVIIRTAGMQAARKDLVKDFQALCDTWQQIDKGAQIGRAPTLLYREPDIVIRTIRDYFSTEVSRIAIDDDEEYQEALNYFTDRMPDLVKILERHRRKEPIFQYYGIEQAIEELFERQVKLPSGGYIIIEQTEALVSIDVNSGKSTREEDHEATVYKTNLEAADEIARQLRLRDMGGIVVVDFIDMASMKHRRDVEKRVRDNMYPDKARVKIGRISENGTLELTRQRLRQSHQLISHVPCSHCRGTGRVRDAEGLAISALRQIWSHISKRKGNLAKVTIKLPVDVANILNNQKRRELVSLGDTHLLAIDVIGVAHMSDSDIDFSEERRGQAGLDAAQDNNHARQKSHPRGQHESWVTNHVPQPPPSIGPAPTFIEPEAIDLEAAPIEQAPKLPVRYDDPLLEALFGEAPISADAPNDQALTIQDENLESLAEDTVGDLQEPPFDDPQSPPNTASMPQGREHEPRRRRSRRFNRSRQHHKQHKSAPHGPQQHATSDSTNTPSTHEEIK